METASEATVTSIPITVKTEAVKVPVKVVPPKKVKVVAFPKAKKAVAKHAKKVAKKAAKKPEAKKEQPRRPERSDTRKRKPGPAASLFKTKKERVVGECFMLGCKSATMTHLSRWCATHKKEVRKAQLQLNNRVWYKRVAQGTAGHHLCYGGKPTVFAVENPDKALKQCAKSGITEPAEYKKLLAQARKQSA